MAGDWLLNVYDSFVSNIPEFYRVPLVLLFFTAVVVIYSVFVYYFYRFLAKKNIIELNLNKYSGSEHPSTAKFLGVILYILEYVIILPVLTFFWFAVLSIFLLVLARDINVATILTISAALVAAVRVTAYITQKLSVDLAKMMPFTLLGLAIINPDFFDVPLFIGRIGQIPSLFGSIVYYLLFIVVLEFLMRMIDLIASAFNTGAASLESVAQPTQ